MIKKIIAIILLVFVSFSDSFAYEYILNEGDSISDTISIANAGDTIILNQGSYEGDLYIDKDLIIKKGEGDGDAVIKISDNETYVANEAIIFVNDASLTLENITLDGNKKGSQGLLYGIFADNATLNLKNIEVKNILNGNKQGIGIYSKTSEDSTSNTELSVDGGSFYNTRSDFIKVENESDIAKINVIVTNSFFDGAGDTGFVKGKSAINIAEGNVDLTVKNSTFANLDDKSKSDTAVQTAIFQNAKGSTAVIIENQIQDCNRGIFLAGEFDKVEISKNEITSSSQDISRRGFVVASTFENDSIISDNLIDTAIVGYMFQKMMSEPKLEENCYKGLFAYNDAVNCQHGFIPERSTVPPICRDKMVYVLDGEPIPTYTPTPTFTLTYTPTATPTYTLTFTPTATNTITPTPTATFTYTLTPTMTYTPTLEPTSTWTMTPTPTATSIVDPTFTFTPTTIVTWTSTPTATPTKALPTATPTYEPYDIDTEAPKISNLKVRFVWPDRLRVAYKATDDSGKVKDLIEVQSKTGNKAFKTIQKKTRKLKPNGQRRAAFTLTKKSNTKYRTCVTSSDETGNKTKKCKSF